jgi:hypothetical protein
VGGIEGDWGRRNRNRGEEERWREEGERGTEGGGIGSGIGK